MKLRTKYILFVVIIHAVALVLSYFILSENKILFIASEVFVLISIWLSLELIPTTDSTSSHSVAGC
jgi:hypothetical protein